MKNTTIIGQKGESFVCQFLKKKGMDIVARNVHEKFAEIDIVASDATNNMLVFVEVRTRQHQRLGHPVETITEKKKQHIRRAATAYLTKNRIRETAIRFDVATIIWEEDKFEYFENAF